MGNKKNHARKNKRLANNWRMIIRNRKTKSQCKNNPRNNIEDEKIQISSSPSNNLNLDEFIEIDHGFEENTNTLIIQEDGHSQKLPNVLENYEDVDNQEVSIGCGMNNLGNSCFFNACLQALFHIPTINIHLQNVRAKKCTCDVCIIIKTFKDTHAEKNQRQYSYNPTNLYNALQRGNEGLLNKKQQDAHEFWSLLMDVLESEGNCSTDLYSLFVHDFVTIVKCGYCHSMFHTKRKCCGHVIQIRGRLTVSEALNAYFAEEVLETYQCNSCTRFNNEMAKKEYLLESVPNILCLLLNRFENKNKKLKDNIQINEQLKLRVPKEAREVNYKLVSVINHFGATLYNGHYTAIACGLNNTFYEFNDSRVHNVDGIIGSDAYILLFELSNEEQEHFNFDEFIEIDDGFEEITNKGVIQEDESENNDHTNKNLPNGLENFEDVENQEINPVVYSCDEFESDDRSDPQNQELRNETENNTEDVQNQENNDLLSGRRVVDIAFLFEQMKYLNKHSGECNSEMVCTKETKLGFRSIFHFKCSDCGVFHQVQSSSKNGVEMNVNKTATLGITSTGSGFYHLEELCAHWQIPCMSSSTFDSENKKLQEDWWELGNHHAKEALKEEIDYAIATGSVDSAGNALITVICDGSWGKRSYRKGFSSLSGCAAIIGLYTKKVLYYNVKNKYCHTCELSYANFCPPNDHPCNISYVGPSSGMETEIIVEGFLACERMGARFPKIISDGDSSAFKQIRELNIYRNPDLVVEKFECVNHLFKNAKKKFKSVCNDTSCNLQYRKLIKPSIGDDLCTGIRSAAKHWRESNVNPIQKLENLEKDCLNAPYHYFGSHDNCDRYFCNKTTTSESTATIDLLKSGGIFYEILNQCNIFFASNVKSILEDCTTNAAEELNNVIAKYLGGKRINYSLAGSYTGRVSAAIVQYNSKGHAGSEFHKLHSMNTDSYCLNMENTRIRHYAKNEVSRQVKPRQRVKKDKITKGYGGDQTADLSEHAYEIAKNIVLDKLNTNQLNRDMILTNTVGQKHNLEWLHARKKLINCSYFGRIINSRGPKSYSNLLYEMLYTETEFGNSAEILHHRLCESEALEKFCLVRKEHQLEKTGIFIDEELSYLAASPLRLYGTDAIVSVQCPVKVFQKTFDEALSKKYKKWLPYLKIKDGELLINTKSSWYMEVQGQLHITGRKLVHLVVWLGVEFLMKEVAVDHAFWKSQMKPKLTYFFNEAMIKELADPRKARRMKIRQFDSQKKAFI